MIQIDVNKIVSFSVYEKLENTRFNWKNEVKLFNLITTVKEGFHWYYLSSEHIENDQILERESRCYIENKKVYYKPHADFRMVNGNQYSKYFETTTELNDFMDNQVLPYLKVIGVDKHNW